jgi:hypothetical protein
MATRVHTITGRTRAALEQAATKKREHATTEGCDRVLVVYQANTARVFVESHSKAVGPRGRSSEQARRRT